MILIPSISFGSTSVYFWSCVAEALGSLIYARLSFLYCKCLCDYFLILASSWCCRVGGGGGIGRVENESFAFEAVPSSQHKT